MVLANWPFESASPFRQKLLIGWKIETEEARAWIACLRKEDFNWNLMRPAYRHLRGSERLIQDLVRRIATDNTSTRARVIPGEKDLADFVDFFEFAKTRGSALGKAANELFEPNWSGAEILAVFKGGGEKRKRAGSIERIQKHMRACRGLRDPGVLSEMVFDKDLGNHFRELLGAALTSEPAIFKFGKPLADALVNFFTQMEPYVKRPLEDGDLPISLVDRYMHFAFIDFAVREIQKRVECVKLDSGRWGYADLIHRVVESVLMPDSPLLSILRGRFSAVLIDEFQDTDTRQWMFFKRVFG